MKTIQFRKLLGFCLPMLLSIATSMTVHAHMAWLGTDDDGHAIFWFGESTADRTYHLPESVGKIKLHSAGNEIALKTKQVDSDHLVGLRSEQQIAKDQEISGSVVYGLYHGMKLTYHVEHLPHQDPSQWPSQPREGAALQSVITQDGDGVQVQIFREGKPVSGASVKLYCAEGHEEGQAETNEDGTVRFSGSEVEPGLNGIVVGISDKEAAGTYEGAPFKSSSDYLTATFVVPGAKQKAPAKKMPAKGKAAEKSDVSVVPANHPDLPEELTSFGAAILGDTVYVYGGHTGEAHSYSNTGQSDRMWSLDLTSADAEWKKCAAGQRLQGLALVAWNGRLVRLGGFTAMNDEGDEHDLRSQSSVAVYDPAQDIWTDLAELPEPRSSMDAAVLGDVVYVFGGWELMGGDGKSRWHDTAWALDLSKPNAQWEKLADPGFQRRAISVAAHNKRLYMIGGMQSKGGPTTKVAVYDPKSDSWSEGPTIPGGPMSGFGSSSFAVGGDLYVTCSDGGVHRLSDSGTEWETVAKSDPGRFFHRMLPYNGDLLMLGGANMSEGKFTHIDQIRIAN